ncbi:MAG: PA2169 family four-helix-bundle protein [Acidobacteriaceae bacterium]|nr:PA2169 family four-helix-bundle protein [Acidobacteriaceae bacterium]
MGNHDQDQVLRALNDLIATCHDAEEGYAKAAKGVHNPRLSDRLVSISGARARSAGELAELVAGLGAEPARDAHFGGILHRGWVDLETRIRPKTEIEMLLECIEGDRGTLKHYEHALGLVLPENVRAVVEQQFKAVQSDLSALEELTQRGKVQHA